MTMIKKVGKKALEAFKSVAYAMSTEETRYYLMGVCLEVVEGKATITAIDGHQLATVPLTDWHVEGEDCRIIIPANIINKVIGLKPKEFIEICSCHDDENNIIGWAITIDDGIKINFQPVDGNFPDYPRVLPKKPNLRIKLDKSYLLNLLKTIPDKDVILDIVDENAPLSISTDNGAQFVVMSKRL